MKLLSMLAFQINMKDLWQSLEIMWKGMLAIFIVIVAIIIVTALLNKFTSRSSKK